MAEEYHHHHHDHHEQHEESNTTHSFTEQNRSHWNKFASSYTKEEWQVKMINDVTEFILANISWIGVDFIDPSTKFETSDDSRTVRVLDYACGPGTMTNALQSHATEFVGIDLSENMVKAYNARFVPADGSTAEPFNAHAVEGNLLNPNEPSPASISGSEFFNFDLAVVGFGFHHFEDLEHATKQLVGRLKSGGVFMIVDFLPHQAEDTKHPAQHTVAHLGFSEERVRELFSGAGLGDFGILKMDHELLMKGLASRTAFLARGRKP